MTALTLPAAFTAALLGALPLAGHAESFVVPDAPGGYRITVRHANSVCMPAEPKADVKAADKTEHDEDCAAPAIVSITRAGKALGPEMPTPNLGDGWFTSAAGDAEEDDDEAEADAAPPQALAYADQHHLIVADFNFDGQPDIAVHTSNQGPYGGPTYDIYVYQPAQQRFLRSADLSDLTHETLGLFALDRSRHEVVATQKDGCCWHLTDHYRVSPDGRIAVTWSVEEAMTADGKFMDITTTRHNGRKTLVTHQRRPMSAYE